jgi:hypothetical protein
MTKAFENSTIFELGHATWRGHGVDVTERRETKAALLAQAREFGYRVTERGTACIILSTPPDYAGFVERCEWWYPIDA